MSKDNIELVKKLLDESRNITKKYDMISRETGIDFNLFDIVNIATDERSICRVLCELLLPSGNHGLGEAYLEIFLKDCLQADFNKADLYEAKIYPEHKTGRGRYIDFVIKLKDKFIPIEVKIYAGDQDLQCLDYYRYAENMNKQKQQLVYLTLSGGMPPEHSAKGLTKEYDKDGNHIGYKEVKQISFSYEIIRWLEKCLALPDTIRKAPIREIILQLIRVLRRITNQLEDTMSNEMIKEIMQSPEYLKSAVAIYNSLEDCRKAIITNIFDEVENYVKHRYGINRLNNGHDYKNDNCSFAYPGISYKLCNLKEKLELWLRVEIDQYMFVGFCIAEGGKAYHKKYKEDIPEIENISSKRRYNDSWWCYYEDFEEKDNTPRFKGGYNEMFYKMLDKETRKEFVSLVVEKFDRFYTQHYKK